MQHPDELGGGDAADKPREPRAEGASPAERLTDRQRVFADCYLGEHFLNATRAARAAGYSDKCAAQQGSRNLAKPHIRRYIDQRLRKHGITADRILAEKARIVFGGNIADFELFLVGRKTMAELEAEGVDTSVVARAESVATRYGVSYSITFRDRLAAARDLAKLLGMWPGRRRRR